MPVQPPFTPPQTVPNYWSLATLSFNRSTAFPSSPEYWNVFPNDIRVLDLNGDGHLDVLQVYSYIPDQNRPGIPIRILLGDGNGHFIDGTSSFFPNGMPLGNAASNVSIADFNGDGVMDVFIPITWETPQPKDAPNVLLLSNGNGGLVDASATLPHINDYSHWSTAADIDGDGDVDIYVGNIGGDPNSPQGDITSYFLINDGLGHFARSDTRLPQEIENGDDLYTSSLLFDADNDGDNDLLLGMWGRDAAFQNNGAFSSLVLFNDGTGHFLQTPQSALPAPIFDVTTTEVLGINAVDLNGDGYLDALLLTDTPQSRYIQVLINNGNGTFSDQTASRLDAFEPLAQDTGRYMHLVDVNEDGYVDLVLQTGGERRFYLNDGSGAFVALPPDFLFTNDGLYAFVPGDFNEDGRVDFFVRNFVNSWDDPANVTEFDWIATWSQPAGTSQSGDGANNALLGVGADETLNGLGGDDVMFGGAGADLLQGGQGDDYLNGGDGADVMQGGAGNDVYFVDSASDAIVETAGAGTDEVRTVLAAYTLGADVENLTGSAATGQALTGNALLNRIVGNSGNDAIDGAAGADVMVGGLGNDVYIVDNVADQAVEAPGGGTDGVQSSVTFTLGAEVENLVLTGSGAVNGTGNNLANQISGNGSANVLNGGAGADRLAGGGGDDLYYVDNALDSIVEAASAGTDTARSSVTFTLSANVEALVLTGSADINATGNALANSLTGNAENNVLDGGAGADAMAGSTGNDIYIVDNGGDSATEASGAGVDSVRSSVSFTLGANIEQLVLTGSGAIDGTGNGLNNTLTGNGSANHLYGGAGNDILDGGAALDILAGGTGNDTYIMRSGDTIVELAGEGIDTVLSDVNTTLAAELENLTLTGAAQRGTGNGLANTITGNASDNSIEGAGGADRLYGGGGNDTFLYRSTADSTAAARDTISGFGAGDRINLAAIDANTANPSGNDAFTFIGSSAFHHVAGELRLFQSGTAWFAAADTNGDGLTDLLIGISPASGYALSSADFVL